MMFLRLDDYTVPGFGLRVSGAFQLKKVDASGETSSTTKADKGTKGKTLTVTTQIRYQDEADLRELIRISEAKGSGESGKVYTITNTTANAARNQAGDLCRPGELGRTGGEAVLERVFYFG